MKKSIRVIMALCLSLFCFVGVSCSNSSSTSNEDNFIDVNKPVIGIAWVPDRNEAFYQNWEYIISKAGGIPVNLNQVKLNDIKYDVHNLVVNSELGDEGMLSKDAANKLMNYKFDRTNIEEVMKGVDGVFMPGGEDISPTIISDFKVEENTCSGFSATRDISDYILEKYCIEKDIPMFCVCRGMQMLSVVSGAHMIQDIPDYCAENSIAVNKIHRDPNEDGPKEFVRHNVRTIDKDSTYYQIVKTDVFANPPSWHHQAVHDVSNTDLREVAIDDTGTFKVIEAVEMKGKSFIMGTQFHPEVVINRVKKQGLEDPCNVGTCLEFFETFVNIAEQKSLNNPINRTK